ncbi:MAG: hemerythrin domain-containing protein [Silvanigrellales bacterium]|nr:hemerythrin domain-containing protein [Silvanigrellales bacterium]
MTIRGIHSPREGIASKLADITARQRLINSYDDWLLSEVDDDDVRIDLQSMAQEDERNLKLLETISLAHGVRVEPQKATLGHIDLARGILDGNEYSVLEKIAEYSLLKQMQVSCGRLVQLLIASMDKDIRMAVGPIAALNGDNETHVKKASTMMEAIGRYEIAGETEERGLWSRMKEAFASATMPVVGGLAKPVDDMPLTSVLVVDHRKVSALFKEILATEDVRLAQERFHQLYIDFHAHSLAEEKVLYETLRFRGGFAEIDHSYEEHEEARTLFDDIRSASPDSAKFKSMVSRLESLVSHHVDEEEDRLFPKIKERFSENELIVLSRRFKEEKMQAQESLALRSSRPRRDSSSSFMGSDRTTPGTFPQ